MMKELFCSLLCYTLALPLTVQASTSSDATTSHIPKKVSRKELAQAQQTKSPSSQKQNKSEKKPSSSEKKKPQSSSTVRGWELTDNEKENTKKKTYYYTPQATSLLVADNGEKKTSSEESNEEKEDEERAARDCIPGPSSFRASLAHVEGNGIGYNDGYSSLDFFFLFSHIKGVYPFFDLRGHISNTSKPAGNFGFGLRFLPEKHNVILGVNAFFDFRQARHSTFEQVGAGIEILGALWDFHANGYFPIIQTSNLIGLHFFQFSQHQALFHYTKENALTGYDASLGRLIFKRGMLDLHGLVGGYYFNGKQHANAVGGLVNLTSHLSRFFTVQAQGSYDSLYKGVVQGSVAFNVPVGRRVRTGHKSLSCARESLLANHLTEPVTRFEMIVTHLHQSTTPALNPQTGQPLFIEFVNNTSSGGDGTYENPFSTLAAAEAASSPGNMIYVFPGDGTTTGMNVGITLQDNQILQGSADSIRVLTSQGYGTIPAQTTLMPTITSGSGNTVTLGNNNTINGIAIQGATNSIAGTSISGATITNNLFVNATSSDLALSGFSGQLTFSNNQSLSNQGIEIITTSNFTANILNNTFNNPGTNNVIMAISGGSQSNIDIVGNAFLNSVDGVVISNTGSSSSTMLIESNTFAGMTGTTACLGLIVDNTANMTGYIINNVFNSAISGITTESSTNSSANFVVLANTITDSSATTTAGITFFTDNNSTTIVALSGNVSNAPVGYFLDNNISTATLAIQSPNLALTGVQSLNTGSFTTSGTITYIQLTADLNPADY